MRLVPKSFRLRHLPIRVAAGMFLLNSGVGKRNLPTEHATALQESGAKGVPLVTKLSADQFGTALSHSELTLGAALLCPLVPPAAAGLGLSAFSAGLLTMYIRNSELHHPKSLRPTQQGVAIAKDSWLLGIGLSLLIDGCLTRRRRKQGR